MTTIKHISNNRESVVHTSRTRHRNRHFSFEVQDLTLPNGVRTEMAMVRHPGSTGIVAVLDDGRIVMIRQYRHVVGGSLLEIPAGTTEPGEVPIHCAKRELEEETGFVAGQWISLGNIHILPAYTDEMIHVYLARECTMSRPNPDHDEIIEVSTYSYPKLMSMIEAGDITDALTILALYRAGERLKPFL